MSLPLVILFFGSANPFGIVFCERWRCVQKEERLLIRRCYKIAHTMAEAMAGSLLGIFHKRTKQL
jgi:hypothetical protein